MRLHYSVKNLIYGGCHSLNIPKIIIICISLSISQGCPSLPSKCLWSSLFFLCSLIPTLTLTLPPSIVDMWGISALRVRNAIISDHLPPTEVFKTMPKFHPSIFHFHVYTPWTCYCYSFVLWYHFGTGPHKNFCNIYCGRTSDRFSTIHAITQRLEFLDVLCQ